MIRAIVAIAFGMLLGLSFAAEPASADAASGHRSFDVSVPATGSWVFDVSTPACSFVHEVYTITFGDSRQPESLTVDACTDVSVFQPPLCLGHWDVHLDHASPRPTDRLGGGTGEQSQHLGLCKWSVRVRCAFSDDANRRVKDPAPTDLVGSSRRTRLLVSDS